MSGQTSTFSDRRKHLSGSKLARVLAKLGIDFHAFVSEYDSDDSRAPRATALTDTDRAAIGRFLTHGEVRKLAKELGCSVPSAHTRITRFALERRSA